jgi:hypothetical protein
MQYAACIASDIHDTVERMELSRTKMTNYRNLMSERLRNYTCADPLMESRYA